MGNTTVRVVTDLKDFESLRGVWDSLQQKCRDENSIYLTHEWLLTWWKHFREGKKLNILLIEKEDQVIGIFPLMKTEYRVGLIKLHALETIGVMGRNYVGLIPPESREEAITAFLAYLEEELAKNRLILRLNLVPGDSRFFDLLWRHSSLFSKSLAIHQKVTTLALYIPLPKTWGEYFGSLSKKRRWNLRRALQPLEKAHAVEYQEYTAVSLEEGLSKLLDLHQRRWQSVHISGVFSNPKVKEFYRDIANQFLKKNWLHFSYLTVDSKVVSALYGFVYNQKLCTLTAARDIRYSEYSVGHLHKMYLIKDAIRKQLREVDFQQGEQPYKFYWTKSARRCMQVIIMRKGLCPGLRLKLLDAFWRLYGLRQYGLRESYYLNRIKRREIKERKKMGLKVKN